jgi:CTP-dependent riboflavin kinase
MTPAFEQNLLKNEIGGNFGQMLTARERGEDILERTFEGRMNRALEAYFDLMKVTGRLAIGVGDERIAA